jgi:hypothetical protein
MSDPLPPGTPPARPLRVGDVLYGYCGGIFGRDSYGAKRVEAIGADWVVVREDNEPLMFEGDPESLLEYTTKPTDWENY